MSTNTTIHQPFTVVAGKFEGDGERNYKYVDSFADVMDAVRALDTCKGYHFAEIEYRAAPQPSAKALTDEQILALNHGERYFSESPSKYPEAGHGTQYHCGAPGLLKFARALLAAEQPSEGKRDASTEQVCREVVAERARQTVLWGGPEHDDEHTNNDFLRFIHYQMNSIAHDTPDLHRARFVKIAALAVAAVERIDREGASE
ncbi:hypothetical protein [Cupriavidus basilensis]|uniref:hypothetical protein n=1 Tax=Cupriavidus basilensis TaxID=68895 RepID=UPI0039F6723B